MARNVIRAYCNCLESYFGKTNVRNPIIEKPNVWSPIIANFSLIGGDFNIIRYASEKNRNGGVHRHTNLLNSLINFYGLRELNMSGGIYTWSNNQEPPTLVKLV